MSDLSKWVGIDQGCTKMLMTAEFNGSYIDKTLPTGMNVTKEYLIKHIDEFIKSLPFVPEGIGMATVGLLESDTLVSSHLKNLEGMSTDMFATDRYACYFINDVKAAMVCESENYINDESLVLIMAGSGLAMTVRERGIIIKGRHGWSGELGSNVYPLNNKIEDLDSISGGYGILKRAGCDINTLLHALEENEQYAVDVINQAGTYFGLALVDIMHTFNPEYIIVGGSTATYKNYLSTAKEIADKYTYSSIRKDCQIVSPKDAKRIVALGARLYGYRQVND